jgi:diadenosine tetraphosphate (Ap4A) HIT family hydrolase/8-oxo-dGTP pyrophosphatase MutT (NUDIX family)
MENDFFCNVQRDNSKIVFENKYFFGFYDDSPINSGHLLIVSKRHVNSIFELSPSEQSMLYPSIYEGFELLKERYKPDGYNIVVNEGAVSGKILNHVIIHLIPRYKGDSPNPVATGARSIRGFYLKPANPPLPFKTLAEIPTEDELRNLIYNPDDPNKRFYLGLKALIRNEEGQILALEKDRGAQFVGQVDLPGGRCEGRDKEEYRAVQREVFEETGVNIKNITYFDNFIFWDMQFHTDRNEDLENRTGLILFLYLAFLPEGKHVEIKKKREGIKAIRWMWPDELSDALTQYPMRVRQRIKELQFRE